MKQKKKKISKFCFLGQREREQSGEKEKRREQDPPQLSRTARRDEDSLLEGVAVRARSARLKLAE